ncbi:MAG: CAP domain-containing protein [Oscillospiraceae bacterium]|nr:CAP domain-containing protein [Oscillospiraceae bacterium]
MLKKTIMLFSAILIFSSCARNVPSESEETETSTFATETTQVVDTSLTQTTSASSALPSSTAITPARTQTATTTAAATTAAPTTPATVQTTVQTTLTIPPQTVSTPQVILPQTSTAQQTVPSASTDFKQAVVDLVNAERAKAGVGALAVLPSVEEAAQVRAGELIISFSHTRPNGTSCFTVLSEFGVGYSASGENIAAGQKTPQAVMESWMNSSGHKANILNPDFTHIGIGYAEGGNYGTNWVQLFVKTK